MVNRNFAKDVLFGVAVGDALGVPFEFKQRNIIKRNPAIDMIGYGSHNQPAGTWSDDSSLSFCLAEMLCDEYNLQNLANRFINWKKFAYWTAHDDVFDMGVATSGAINKLENGISPVLAGGDEEGSNGNGSLMRILPLIFYIQNKSLEQRFQIVKEVSSLTHRHIRSILSCFIYTEYALQLLNGIEKFKAFEIMQKNVYEFYFSNAICTNDEIKLFERILQISTDTIPLFSITEDKIFSSGYVLHTLEASVWCILNTDSYKDAVLKAVNLGGDTDTTAAVTGGLAGLIYGYEAIPNEWMKKLAKKSEIEDLCNRLSKKLFS